MDGKFGKGLRTPVFNIESGAELECWRKFIKRFEIAVIGAGLKTKDSEGATTRKQKVNADLENYELEQKKAALLLNSMGEYGMNIFETWDIQVESMQYENLKAAFDEHFARRENVVATRHRFLSMEQQYGEKLDKFIERVERSGSTCRWGGLEEEMNIQIVIKGMRVDKVRNDLLLKKELSLSKVKNVCNRYESAMAASKIIRNSEPRQLTVSEVDRVEEQDNQENAQEEEVDNIDRVGASGFSGNSFRGRGFGRSRGGRGRGRGCWTCGGFAHDYKACAEKAKKERGFNSQAETSKCYVCGETDHIARNCPDKFSKKDTGKGKINAVAGYISDSDQESL